MPGQHTRELPKAVRAQLRSAEAQGHHGGCDQEIQGHAEADSPGDLHPDGSGPVPKNGAVKDAGQTAEGHVDDEGRRGRRRLEPVGYPLPRAGQAHHDGVEAAAGQSADQSRARARPMASCSARRSSSAPQRTWRLLASGRQPFSAWACELPRIKSNRNNLTDAASARAAEERNPCATIGGSDDPSAPCHAGGGHLFVAVHALSGGARRLSPGPRRHPCRERRRAGCSQPPARRSRERWRPAHRREIRLRRGTGSRS